MSISSPVTSSIKHCVSCVCAAPIARIAAAAPLAEIADPAVIATPKRSLLSTVTSWIAGAFRRAA